MAVQPQASSPGRVPHVRPPCPGVPWGVRGPKMTGDSDFLLRGATNVPSKKKPEGYGLQSLRENQRIAKSVPQGRLNLAQDASPGLDLQERPVPQGRLELGRDEILDNLQPSLRDLIMFHDVPRTNVLG